MDTVAWRSLLALSCLLLAAASPDLTPDAVAPAATARLRAAEEALSDSVARVSALAAQRADAERHLQESAQALGPLLPLAERLALFPTETLLAVPAPPEQAIRGLSVLHGLMRSLETQSAALRAEIAKVDAAQRALEAALPALRAAEAEQARESAVVDRQVAAARAARAGIDDAAADEARRAAAEATRADSVRGAIAAMAVARERAQQQIREDADRAQRQRREAAVNIAREREAQVSAPAGPGVQPGGGAVLPVAGPLIKHWGEPTEAGPANGLSFQAPPSGRVSAPCAGRVAFAAPFRSYGTLIILDCGRGWHFVLAGLGRLDTEAGAAVAAGEPLGVMPGWDPESAGKRPALYLELRHDGQPVDPSPFLRDRS